MKDILGTALLDYYNGNYTEDIYTETSISEEDVLPIPYLFRTYNEMPALEKKALQLCQGTILDIGCGAGSHSLYLQEKGFRVVGLDNSKGAIEVCKLRGVEHLKNTALLDYSENTFDTLLLLMNGTGIFESLSNVDIYLKHLKSLLNPNGKILIDSSDLKYMYDTTDEGGIMVPADRYYGELDYAMRYKKMQSPWFKWLYLDEAIFEQAALYAGLNFEVLQRGSHYDYLAQLTLQ